MGRLTEIKDRLSKAMPLKGHMNYPFSGFFEKPRPSLSKHDNGHSHGFWHCDDVKFLCGAYDDIKWLIAELEKHDKK